MSTGTPAEPGTLASMATTAQSVAEVCAGARRASRSLAQLDTTTKNAALLAMADDSGSVGDGVSLADGLPEQPATANINAAAATRSNRLILISSMPTQQGGRPP